MSPFLDYLPAIHYQYLVCVPYCFKTVSYTHLDVYKRQVRNSDAIMVLDHGRIIERGNHDELIAPKGTYYQLYTGAFELE